MFEVADASQINFEDFFGSLGAAQAVVKKVEDVTANDMIFRRWSRNC